ncbi:MAG: class I SAM-dependent methyltransferase [Patescibacteria group bacterium]
MKLNFRSIVKGIGHSPLIDVLLFPFVFISAVILRAVRRIGLEHLKISKKALLKVGVMPICNHYYEPLFDKKCLRKPLSENRELPGIDWNITEQISLLEKFHYNDEFDNIPSDYIDDLSFNFNNDSFESGDAEYWYNIVRLKKPKTIVEIGSGSSTKIAQLAIKKNIIEDENYKCEHICIEPYEMPWLEELNVDVIRKKVEEVNKEVFKKLDTNDILFIDSSHMIRPQGDVLYEYLELLPTLNNGVIVHIHDIFSPKDYPEDWVIGKVRFWNEQYLLEAFLTSNSKWRIIGALNFLHHKKYKLLKDKCPRLTPEREPGSFYIQKQA